MFSGLRSVCTRFKSCRTILGLVGNHVNSVLLTGYTHEQLPRETLNLRIGKGHKAIALEEIKDTLSEEIHDDADVTPVVEAVAQVYTAITIFGIVHLEGREDA